jgi:hypothetical protein
MEIQSTDQAVFWLRSETKLECLFFKKEEILVKTKKRILYIWPEEESESMFVWILP